MSKPKKKFIACPDCRKKFLRLEDLNKHLARSSHNEGKKITRQEFAKSLGAKIRYVINPS